MASRRHKTLNDGTQVHVPWTYKGHQIGDRGITVTHTITDGERNHQVYVDPTPSLPFARAPEEVPIPVAMALLRKLGHKLSGIPGIVPGKGHKTYFLERKR